MVYIELYVIISLFIGLMLAIGRLLEETSEPKDLFNTLLIVIISTIIDSVVWPKLFWNYMRDVYDAKLG